MNKGSILRSVNFMYIMAYSGLSIGWSCFGLLRTMQRLVNCVCGIVLAGCLSFQLIIN